MTLGGGNSDFLPVRGSRVVAGRFTEKRNPRLPRTLLVGDSGRRLKAAARFRSQTEFIPVFIQPLNYPRVSEKWRYEGRFRVVNRVPDRVKDDEAARLATIRWRPNLKVSLVLHLEPEGAVSDQAINEAEDRANFEDVFDPANVIDARDRIATSIVLRRGQPEFRKKLLIAYDGRCAVSDCNCIDALEAAHIHPYRGDETNDVTNGLLLRADLHTLFDLGKLTVNSVDYTIIVSGALRKTVYWKLHGAKISPAPGPGAQAERRGFE